jgi:hypothetical protein
MAWEYLTVAIICDDQRAFNRYGAEGWELVAAVRASGYALRCLFKRPVPPEGEG